jgi:hypothetical protein
LEQRSTHKRNVLEKQGWYNPSREELMLKLSKVVQQLKKEREQTQAKLGQLDTALKVLGEVGTTGLRANGRRMRSVSRTPMSAAARRKIAAAQRARWAKWRTAQKKK